MASRRRIRRRSGPGPCLRPWVAIAAGLVGLAPGPAAGQPESEAIPVERENGTYRLVAMLGEAADADATARDVVCFYRTDGDHFAILDCVLESAPYVSRDGQRHERAYVLELAVEPEPGYEVRAKTIRGVVASPLSETRLRLIP